MEDDNLHQTAALIQSEFELIASPDSLTEEELLDILADKIGYLLETQPEYLFSMLYRLDVLEKKIRPVLLPSAPEPANWGLARLVIERQKERIATKKSIKPPKLDDMDGWEW